jgi:thiol-disulfide isomerase/thioredoxin
MVTMQERVTVGKINDQEHKDHTKQEKLEFKESEKKTLFILAKGKEMKQLSLTFIVCFLSLFLSYRSDALLKSQQDNRIQELYAKNLTNNLLEWENDLAIVFYVPWCEYCKHMFPVWQSIASLTKHNKNLVLGKFNCEFSTDHTSICQSFGVDRYPSIYFVGYGNFNQAPAGEPFGKAKFPSVVRYTADLYPDAIYDWIRLLHTMSTVKRKWDGVWSFWNGKAKEDKKLLHLKIENEALTKKVKLFGDELERYKAAEIFDDLEDNGDAFPLLHDLPLDEVNNFFNVYIYFSFNLV